MSRSIGQVESIRSGDIKDSKLSIEVVNSIRHIDSLHFDDRLVGGGFGES